MSYEVAGLIISVIALVGAGISWLLSDAHGKGRMATVEPKLRELDQLAAEHDRKIAANEERLRSLTAEIARLDRDKAGREFVETVAGMFRDMKADVERTLRELKTDIDRRFDRLERLERSHGKDAE